jgi:hypothetical protein
MEPYEPFFIFYYINTSNCFNHDKAAKYLIGPRCDKTVVSIFCQTALKNN